MITKTGLSPEDIKMKKILVAWLLLVSLALPVQAADQWDKAEPSGLELAGLIDNLLRVNNAALDRLLGNYRTGTYSYGNGNSNQFVVSAGDISISNAAGTLRKFRSNPSAITVTWASMDVGGGDVVSTVYYIYATADTDVTSFVVKISANASSPTGSTFYRKIGSFYNNSSGNIEIGGIIEMFSGFLSSIPPGYVLCDGTNGTPDLSDRFVIGTKTGSTVGAVGTLGGALTGTGALLRTADASDSFKEQPAGTDGSSESEDDHTHKYPKYFALAFIMRQGVE
jgi:hypothetical protein